MDHAMKKLVVLFFLLDVMFVNAQNDRVNDYNNTNWLQSVNTIRLNSKWSLHAEYQWRRTDGLKYWQQGLLRIGANLKLNDNMIVHAGYAWAETFPYGDQPIAAAGTFPEHRLYEQLTFRQVTGKLSFSHRFRVEQRWLGRVRPNTGNDREIEGWNFLHRFRYQFRTVYQLSKRPYFVALDEVFIGAGKNVGTNIFDQNRIFLLFGYKFNDKISLEAGYFNQTLQQGRRVNNATIMQRNNGAVVSSFLNL
jgi:hypothetical protein